MFKSLELPFILKSFSRKITKQLDRCLFPRECLLCSEPLNSGQTMLSDRANVLCEPCLLALPWLESACAQCALPLEQAGESFCGQCLQKAPPFQRSIALFHYEPPVNHLIAGLKFQQKLVYAELLGHLLASRIQKIYCENLSEEGASLLPDYIVPVPLHRKRLRERGYNQALELARPIAARLNLPINQTCCWRERATTPQSDIKATERKKNVLGAFQALTAEVSGASIALIDDVVTTGSTVTELSRELKRAGARRVEVWCCARTTRRL